MQEAINSMGALLSTVQMPGRIPVVSFAIGKLGAKNAAYLVAQILSLKNTNLAIRIREERRANG